MFSREVVERKQHFTIFAEAFAGFREFSSVLFKECIEGMPRLFACFGHPDVVDVGFGFGLNALGHLVENIGGLVNPAALFARLTEDLS